ncbi:MAG: flavodoxin [Eubacterium sp.]|nr:flavodoxin [Eubacterium sp.]MCM1417608.1 flavodoxin [Roseburia sp.]
MTVTASETTTTAATEPEPETAKVLVAYFSATNTTEGVAERIAEAIGADLYEIAPEIPYTAADLDYYSDDSRSTIEMNDLDARPAISGSVADMGQYDIVFIGYPIWWGKAPRILNTFVESYDLSGKTVVPFCTSGGSGVGSSARDLARSASGANWLDGTRFDGGVSSAEIARWIGGLGLDIPLE